MSACLRRSPTRASGQRSMFVPLGPRSRFSCSPNTSKSATPPSCWPTTTSGIGYLLKERVADVGDFIEACERVAEGGTVLDPEVVAQLLARRPSRGPLDDLTPREREVLGADGRGPFERRHRPPARRVAMAPSRSTSRRSSSSSAWPTATPSTAACWPCCNTCSTAETSLGGAASTALAHALGRPSLRYSDRVPNTGSGVRSRLYGVAPPKIRKLLHPAGAQVAHVPCDLRRVRRVAEVPQGVDCCHQVVDLRANSATMASAVGSS